MQRFYPDRFLKKLANLQLAIGLLLTIGIVVAIGTVIEQDQALSFYQQNYPEERPVLGFINWKILTFLDLDHIYTSVWFTILLFFLAASLLSCSLTVQFPVLRRLRRWKFYTNPQNANGIAKTLSLNTTNKVAYHLNGSQYTIFRQGKKNYAYTGLLGRFGPIVVHASIILLLVGSTIGAFGGYIAQEIVPRGEIFHTQNVITSGGWSEISQDVSWRVNDFWITYTSDFKTNQFYSDLSLLDNFGNEVKRKTVFVNEPLVYKGVTLYQTDWDIVGLKYNRPGSQSIQLPLKKVVKSGQKFWFGSIKDNSLSAPKIFSILVNDLRGNIYIYNEKGTLIQECILGQRVDLTSDTSLTFSEFLTSTGLQIKADPGIRTVYLAFFLLMVSTYVSFISYSQIWGAEKPNQFNTAGNSNRAVLFFQSEFKRILSRSER